MQKFSATIYKLGINPVVDPPDAVLAEIFAAAGKSRGPIPVRGRLNGAQFVQTLVKYRSVWRLYVNGQMLKDSGLGVGGEAEVEIEFDPQPRELPVTVEFESALASDPTARAAFDALTPSRKKEILRYLSSLKSREALERNIEKVVGNLTRR